MGPLLSRRLVHVEDVQFKGKRVVMEKFEYLLRPWEVYR